MITKAFLSFTILILSMAASNTVFGQTHIVQLAKLEIDPARLDSYKAALQAEVETALRVEPGVLSLYTMAEKGNPAHITLVEIYADENAYQAHLQSAHFLKYKTSTKEMVKSLELVRMSPLFPDLKQK